MGKIITFTNQKGGVGKTTSCINVAACLALEGKKVLIADMDPQGNATSGVGIIKKNVKSIYDIIVGNVKITDPGVILHTEVENMDLLPSNIDLAGSEVELASIKEKREYMFKTAIDQVREIYDYVLIDCPPSLGLITVNALTASDSVLIPIQCEFFALEGLSQLMNTVKLIKKFLNHKLEIEGVLITMYDGRSKLTRQVQEEIVKYFDKKLYQTTIPRNIRLAEAPSYGEPCVIYDKRCLGSKAYREFTKEFLRKQN